MKRLGDKVTDVLAYAVGGFIGVTCILAVVTVPAAVVLWAIETIINYLR